MPSPATPTENREARVSELAVGFALGELADQELREFYDYLREPGDTGAAAARVAWLQLGVVTDLRSGMGAVFQDEIRHKISTIGRSDRFTNAMRERMGGKPAGLAPVATAEARRQLPMWPLLVLAALIFLGAMAVASRSQAAANETVCTVAEVQGEATLGGAPLVPGTAIDRRQVVVPSGSQLCLAWKDGSRAVVAGPANAVAQTAGLSLTNGAAWISASAPFVCGLPDDTLRIETGAVVAMLVEDNHSTTAVARGRAAITGLTLAAEDMAQAGSRFPWMHSLAPAATGAASGPRVPEWSFAATIAWKDAAERVELAVIDAQGERLRLQFAPGHLTITRPGAQPSDHPLAGAPMAGSSIVLAAHRSHLSLRRSGVSVFEEGMPEATSVSLLSGADVLKDAVFHSGPAPLPPFAVRSGWPDAGG